MGSEEPRITIQTLKVLAAFISGPGDETSGAEIARSTKIPSGTLYPILVRLEKAGWVKSRWETADPHALGRPRRRLYQVTGVGVRRAQSALREVSAPFKEFAWR